MASKLFAGIADAKVTDRGNFYHAGSFIVKIDEIVDRTGDNATRNAGNAVLIVATVIAVRDTAGNPNPLRPNTKVCHFINDKGKKRDMFLPNLKRALTQLASALDPSFAAEEHSAEDWERILDIAMNKDPKKGIVQGLSSQFIAVNVTEQVARESGAKFSVINYGEGYNAQGLRQLLKALGQPEEITFPNGALQKLIDAETAAAAAEAAAAKTAAA